MRRTPTINQTTQSGRIAAEPTSAEKAAPRAASGAKAPRGFLSKLQKSRLAQEAAKAFKVQCDAGVIDVPFDQSKSAYMADWRHAEQLKACGKASLTDCRNADYRPIMAHFLTLQGREAEAFALHLKSGRVKDHGSAGDTHEARQEFRRLILMELEGHAARMAALGREDIITAAYVEAIARAKHRGRQLSSLTADELRMLLFTTRNRTAQREGRGNSAKRNKSQRKP